ncbi:restriction endonuclease [Mariniflexile sp. HNIBRBA6329]|uniref:restriction endonuclease n=1 Tax=Mariniflexile sp. HNIBRBA6329 TaxID=3373088 RepID=UPI00374516F5
MPIPKHDDIRVPALKLLSEKGLLKLKDFVELLGSHFKLTEEELSEMYPSGNGHIFYDRVSWALSYLNMSDLVEKPKRGTYSINNVGLKLLKTPEAVNDYIAEKLSQREVPKQQKKAVISSESETMTSDFTPAEKLYASFEKIKKTRKDEILNTILSKTPFEFETIVVKLLQKMGYGGEIKDSGLVTKATNDGGIDGVIKEDVLGLGRIHIQAKRYALNNSINRDEIQKFAGALLGAPMSKGVFITTSYFSDGALTYVKNLNNSTIILIDGDQLAEYMYEYGLGMQIVQTIELKKLDTDFWDAMKDD